MAPTVHDAKRHLAVGAPARGSMSIRWRCRFLEINCISTFLAQIAKFEGNTLRPLYDIIFNLEPVATIA